MRQEEGRKKNSRPQGLVRTIEIRSETFPIEININLLLLLLLQLLFFLELHRKEPLSFLVVF